MAANRLPYFPFDVLDYLSDPAVMGMDADAEGCYLRLLARMWQSPTPGVVHPGLVYRMSDGGRLADQYRMFYDGSGETPDDQGLRRWEVVVEQIAMAFDTSNPESWVQRRMVSEFDRIGRIRDSKSRGGRNRWLKDSSRTPQGVVEEVFSYARIPVVGVTETEKAEDSEPSTNGKGKAVEPDDAPGIEGIAEETARQWSQGFDDFWAEYPRKVKREEALKAYMKLRPRVQETYDALFAGLEHWKRGEWAGREPDKIEHCSTWINNRRYLDAQTTR